MGSTMNTSKPVALESTTRRDTLVDIEKRYQEIWAGEKHFEIDAPTDKEEPYGTSVEKLHEDYPKWYSSMAYPYMNGVLHAGHAFTYSKADFATGFERLRGKRALFPLGFHCTGMPILASADKLKREIEMFGDDFSGAPSKEEEEKEMARDAKQKATNAHHEDVTKFTAKKSKVAQKTGRGKFQYEIMEQLGVPRDEIKLFADPKHWLEYFPPLVKTHVTKFGGRVDWRRSMITTDANPYYDSFVGWQMRRLKELGKIKFGKRYTIYSVKDGQPCMDHDRQSGEGVLPQEYTGIKIRVTEFTKEALDFFQKQKFDLSGKKVFLVAATLRPETMYGQTCCFVSRKINYGLFDAGNGEYFVCTKRSFKNMSYQDITPKRGEYQETLSINGGLLVGSKIHAPLTSIDTLRVLPMETILESKGTGVVTCVPSDSPDDFVTTKDLYNKPEYYGIDRDWVVKDPISIVNTSKYGDKCAEYLVNELKIHSPKDANQLTKAKELAYKEGYYNGTLLKGKYVGEKVEVAKPKVKNDLVAANEAVVYSEPESAVMSRSGDECIVSLEDQWYLDYGEKNWKEQALACLEKMNTFNSETNNAFEGVFDWLKNWAVSRTYGLGSRIPWDPKYLVESLSDSTVYQAYYTICHFLHSDTYGQEPGLLNISADQMTDQVWDYVFCRKDEVESDIPKENLQKMRREFEYFYPLDESISGKDLIPNHLTFYIYTNVALFKPRFWPTGIRCNGHLMLNNSKMSKSTGNFRTLAQLVEKFGADASRVAMADAGDSMEDANFDESNANAAILRLYNLKEWCETMNKEKDSLRSGEYNFFDKAFNNEMDLLINETYEHYALTHYKLALKSGFFDYHYARDYYRDVSVLYGGMHRDVVFKYVETQAIMLSPVTPHFAEYLYREILGHKESIHDARWPTPEKPVSREITAELEYVRNLQRSIREAEIQALKKKKKGKASDVDKSKDVKLTLFVAGNSPEWQEKYVEVVRKLFEQSNLDDMKEVKQHIEERDMKKVMPFVSILKKELETSTPEEVFNRELPFDEVQTVKAGFAVLVKAPAQVKVVEITAVSFKSGDKTGKDVKTGEEVEIPNTKSIQNAVPGQPGVYIKNIK
ncbi:cytosolic leucyl tRNA synthetase [Brettanomyces nanus]|uniref:leucine--tRNA ligase n=1 Tax=Eeniella nana TaxID=13502 RepID=A0A875S0V5_EENNA|nr:cytosolic leucyl tRNA synthetase [Brettanomyces nanus]QPG75391.1 cytosolic leucyl tRNA synthetase [Brettanomyces nanus]